MENKENNAVENQLHNENDTVQRNKELFEYEMTEVKLMLAGRFKHFSAADMKNAGADYVIRTMRELPKVIEEINRRMQETIQ